MSDETVSFVDLGEAIDDVKVPEVMDNGLYNLNIQEASFQMEGDEVNAIKARVDFTDYPEAQTMFVSVKIPRTGDDTKNRNTKILRLKRFLVMFKIPYSGGRFNIQDCVGAIAHNAPVQKQSYDRDRDGAPLVDGEGNPTLRWSNSLNLFNN